MCFSKCMSCLQELQALYNADGAVNEPVTAEVEYIPHFLYNAEGEIIEIVNLYGQVEYVCIPEGIHQQQDYPFLNCDLESGILAFIYENSSDYFIVWTSPEAQHMCLALFDDFDL